MSKANLGWLYYKDMYSNGEDIEKTRSVLKKMLEASVTDSSFKMPHNFNLTTVYPGLIIGSGYAHGLKNDEDSKIGFYFDHTSGIPTIPGSSVKGVLRSLFGFPTNKKELYQEEKQALIRELTGKESLDVKVLVDDVFEGLNEKGKSKSIYSRDIFYEARIVKTDRTTLRDDYLAPHKDPFSNPMPIKFIKVSAGVTFEFSFELHDGGGLSADEKLELFFKLLQFNGVGAKTNVGYGQFEEQTIAQLKQTQKQKQAEHEQEKEDIKKLNEAQALEEKLKDATEDVQLFENAKADLPTLIKQMQNNEISNDLLVPLAKLIKEYLQKTPKEWDKAKQKAEKRKKYIQGLLGE